ncbi:MAG TPA: YqhA family protein [Mariprofundaceae bacterium]|nr:YqhA family protein [Mariprofundaceae bacterium]
MIERVFEWLLWNSRFVVILAVLSSVVGMLLLFALAAEGMLQLAWEFIDMSFLGGTYPDFHVEAVGQIISAVDDFLLGTVLLIFALGMYELFISKIDIAEQDANASNILLIHSLDDLKDRLVKVVLMILVVAFFKNVLHVTFDNPLNILYMGGGILLVSLATYFTHKSGARH